MSFFQNKSLLELVEELASYERLPSSEDELSERYDSHLESLGECNKCGTNHILQSLQNDEIALNEAFSNYKDMLHSDGVIHEEQVSQYGYVGAYS